MTSIAQSPANLVEVTQCSDWMVVDQPMIDQFASATLDHQFIHIDPGRAAATPFGGTVAHGFLTLSLLPHLTAALIRAPQDCILINYGFDRLRFVSPVRAGSRIRAMLTPRTSVERSTGLFQQTYDVVVEIEGAEKSAIVATWLTCLLVQTLPYPGVINA